MQGKVGLIYEDFIDRKQNILIAGMTGSGKSVILNGIINSILYRKTSEHKMILIDIKRVEFYKYRNTKHCMKCALTFEEAETTLKDVRKLIDRRLEYMEKEGLTLYDGSTVHLVIDEMAELVLNNKKIATLIQSICQIGRATGIQVIVATQCPLAKVIPTEIKVNFPILIGLHTANAKHSRNILEVNGCEKLPMYGKALIMYPTTGIEKRSIPMIEDEWLREAINADINSSIQVEAL